MFSWPSAFAHELVTGHVIDMNPAHAVRGPKYVVKKGKTPVLTAEEARALLDSIPVRKPAKEGADADQPDLLGLRDRALIGIMVYSFARIVLTQPREGRRPFFSNFNVCLFAEL